MPLSSPVPNAPSALSLNNAAIDAMPDFTHPLTEELVRKIAAGELTGEQAFQQAQQHVQQFNQPQAPAGMPATAFGAAPTQVPQPAPATLGGAPQQPAQPQQPAAPMQAPQQAPQGPPPPVDASLAGSPQFQQAQPPAQASAPAPAPATNDQQQDPLANANNRGQGPSFNSNLQEGRNQIDGSLTNTLPSQGRTQIPQGGMNAQGQQSQAQGPQAPATGYAAARNAIMGLGPRMTNKDVAVFMDAFVKGGKPAIEAEKERGRQFRAMQTDATKNRGLDLREQGLSDEFTKQTNRLSADKQFHADNLAIKLEELEVAKEKLAAYVRRIGQNTEDKVQLQRMKDSAALIRSTISASANIAASMQSEAPAGNAWLQKLQAELGPMLQEAERISNAATARSSDPNAPANNLGTQMMEPGPQAPAQTAGEATKKVLGQKASIAKTPNKPAPKAEPAPVAAAGASKSKVLVRRKSDGVQGMRSEPIDTNLYEKVTK